MRILVCGDREWRDYGVIEEELYNLFFAIAPDEPMVVIHGDCRGADRMAGDWAQSQQCEVVKFPADWKAHGKAAGPIRNRQMLREGKPDFVLAFHDNIRASSGTKDMLRAAKAAGVPARLVSRLSRPLASQNALPLPPKETP